MVFESKGLTAKVFDNKRLSGDLLRLVVKERPKMGIGRLRWPSSVPLGRRTHLDPVLS